MGLNNCKIKEKNLKKSYFHGVRNLLLSIFIVISLPAGAQFQGNVYSAQHSPQVEKYGSILLNPWVGGVNALQLSHADINNDGKMDLVSYDKNTYLIRTYINIGAPGDIAYQYAPKYEANFPDVVDYLILKDYNCDGIPDLFHRSYSGVNVQTGSYNANNELVFTNYKNLFFNGMFGLVNVYVQPTDVPAIDDFDGDGDIDIASYDVLGSYVTFYKNTRVEDNAHCDSMTMVEDNTCFGSMYQAYYREHQLGISCKGKSNKKSRHTGNCLLLFDIDGDSDIDYMDGNVSYSDIQVLYNGSSSPSVVNFTSQDTTWDSQKHLLNLPTWPVPHHFDIDNDGDKDVVIGVHNDDRNSANYNSLAFYKNIGSDASPNFVWQHDSLLRPSMIDVGSYSYPTLFDFDKDGKKDLFIGGQGRLNNSTGQTEARIIYFRNSSTIGNISFKLMDDDFLNLSAKNYPGIYPSFGDVTGDGIDDLIMGNDSGKIAVYKNSAASNSATPNFTFFLDSIQGVDVGNTSFPVVYDFDNDGNNDILVGNEQGKLSFVQDTNPSAAVSFNVTTNSLGNFQAGSVNSFFGYAAPFIGQMDNTGIEYLLIGNVDGTIERYDSFANNFALFPRIDSNYSNLQTAPRSVPTAADLDGDGMYDMLVGNQLGGLHYYKQEILVPISTKDFTQKLELSIYPNPTKGLLHLDLNDYDLNEVDEVRILDISGRSLIIESDPFKNKSAIDVAHLADALYFIQIKIGDKTGVERFIKR